MKSALIAVALVIVVAIFPKQVAFTQKVISQPIETLEEHIPEPPKGMVTCVQVGLDCRKDGMMCRSGTEGCVCNTQAVIHTIPCQNFDGNSVPACGTGANLSKANCGQ